MKNHKYKEGDVVDVFEDPITKEKPEGKAKIVKVRNTEHYYDVQFLDDLDESDVIFGRFIY